MRHAPPPTQHTTHQETTPTTHAHDTTRRPACSYQTWLPGQGDGTAVWQPQANPTIAKKHAPQAIGPVTSLGHCRWQSSLIQEHHACRTNQTCM